MALSAFQMRMRDEWTEREQRKNLDSGAVFESRIAAEDYLNGVWDEMSFGDIKQNESPASYEPRIAKQNRAFDCMFKIVNLSPRKSRRKARP